MDSSVVLKDFFSVLPELCSYHAPGSTVYNFLKTVSRNEIEKSFSSVKPKVVPFGIFKELVFPYFKMGVSDSLNLFDIDELIIFSFYWVNRNRYKNVLDIGANIGLHSIILSKCGYNIRAFEPDPIHFEALKRNLSLNHCKNIEINNKAVSDKNGKVEFIRVLDNTTGSHIAGSKLNPYGALEKIYVPTEDIKSLISWADFIKLDVEGHEKEVLLATVKNDWIKTDALIEVSCKVNAELIYRHFKMLGVGIFSQKINWGRVQTIEEVPTCYQEGSLFISRKDKMPWGEI